MKPHIDTTPIKPPKPMSKPKRKKMIDEMKGLIRENKTIEQTVVELMKLLLQKDSYFISLPSIQHQQRIKTAFTKSLKSVKKQTEQDMLEKVEGMKVKEEEREYYGEGHTTLTLGGQVKNDTIDEVIRLLK